MTEVVLTLRDVEDRLEELQKKYEFTTEQFLQDRDLRNSVSDNDRFDWFAFWEHACALREIQEERHREYLSQIVWEESEETVPRTEEKSLRNRTVFELAA